MIVVDLALAVAALAGLGAFLWIIASFVPEPDLVAILALAFAAAAFDFLREIFQLRRKRAEERRALSERDELESEYGSRSWRR